MKLARYRQKRDFAQTPEPKGRVRKTGDGLRFVVQKHRARRLHFDLRLEWHGVLLSWAVPKGPSLTPGEKRLAVRTEDHPLEYAGFHGTIPAGQYGAGTMEIWDRGRWFPLDDADEGLRSGKLKLRLRGEKLQGDWVLVRSGLSKEPGKENWFLIRLDEAQQPSPVSRQPNKVAALPAWIEPQLATLDKRVPEGDAWLHEIKFDGYRMLCRIDLDDVRFLSRNGKDWTQRFAALVRAATSLPCDQAILDGEVVRLLPSGVSSFQALQRAFQEDATDQLVYQAFDLLYLDGQNLLDLPLIERKQRLAALLADTSGPIRYTEHIERNGPESFRQACRLGLEGVVSKRRDRPYRSGRDDDWIKVKCVLREEFVIGGYTEPAGTRTGFGSLLVGYYDPQGNLAYAGRVGTGFDDQTLVDLHSQLKLLRQSQSPFERVADRIPRRGLHWVRPELVAQIEFRDWTSDGLLRQASFQGLREDKLLREVIQPRAAESGSSQSSKRSKLSPGGDKLMRDSFAGLTITSPDKVLYPEQGITKRALAEYYEPIADWILPHVVGRPLTMVRCPEGRKRQCFYQKHAGVGVPAALDRVPVEEEDGIVEYLAVRDAKGLIALVQMGVLEIHVWGSRADKLDRPDRLVFDLDPDPAVPWQRVTEGAKRVRSLLEDLGLESFVKTTGGKGLHVVVPIARRHGWDEAKQFSLDVAQAIVAAEPKLYTTNLSKAARRGKIFIDYLRNSSGSTAVVAYSTRAKPGSPVSVPLAWEELDEGIRSDHYRIENLPSGLDALRADPWLRMPKLRQSLTQAVRRMASN